MAAEIAFPAPAAPLIPPAALSAEALTVASRPRIEEAMRKLCEEVATRTELDRFEIVVQSRIDAGIKDDNELRLADELIRQVALGGDTVEEATKPAIAAAHALHKNLIAEVKPWRERWGKLRDGLASLILKYNRAKEEMAKRQQQEVDQSSEDQRLRLEQAAREALRNGDVEGAQAVMEQAQSVVTPIIAHGAPTLANSSNRKPWQAEITDPEAVVKGIADGSIPLSVVKEWDLSFIKGEAKKRGGLKWAGIRAWQGDALSVRRK